MPYTIYIEDGVANLSNHKKIPVQPRYFHYQKAFQPGFDVPGNQLLKARMNVVHFNLPEG